MQLSNYVLLKNLLFVFYKNVTYHSDRFKDTQEALKKIVYFDIETVQYMPTVCKCPTKLVSHDKTSEKFLQTVV